jgi:hypothetical protein
MKENLALENDTEEGTAQMQSAALFKEGKLPQLIENNTGTGPQSANHLGRLVLTDLRNDCIER